MLNEVKPNLDLLMSIRLGLAEQYGIPLDVPFRDYKAWYRWTGMEVPTQTMRADFVNQLYSKEGKPCRFEDIFEFERLSKAWLFDEDGLQEWDVDEPRFSNGLFLEPEATNLITNDRWTRGGSDGQPIIAESIYTKIGSCRVLGTKIVKTAPSSTVYRYSVIPNSLYNLNKSFTILISHTENSSDLFTDVRQGRGSNRPFIGTVFPYSLDSSTESDLIVSKQYSSWYQHSVVDTRDISSGVFTLTLTGPKELITEPLHYSIFGVTLVESKYPTTVILNEEGTTTRLRDSLSTTIPQGHTITGDWDDTLHLFERDGQLDFEGYGYIRTLEMIPMVGSYTADFTKDTIISHTGFEHRGIFGRGIFEFERLSKAWTWESNKGMVEFDVNAPRITYEGLRLEPESTNFLVDSFLSSGRAGMQTVGGDLFFGVDELGTHIHFKQTLNDNYAYKNYRDLDAPEGSHSLTYVSDTTGLSWGTDGGSFSLQAVGVFGSLTEVSYGVYSEKANMNSTGQGGINRGLIKRTSHDTKEPKFYLYQLENYPRYTSPIKTEGVPVTRLPETISHPTTLEFLSIDKDEGILHEDGVFSGFGYIRKIEVKV